MHQYALFREALRFTTPEWSDLPAELQALWEAGPANGKFPGQATAEWLRLVWFPGQYV